MNLFSILENAARKWPDRIAVVHEGRCFRYADLYRAAKSLASVMRKAGVRAGDVIGLICPNSADSVVAFFAAWKSGAIVNPISPALKPYEIAKLARSMTIKGYCYSAHLDSIIPETAGTRSTETHRYEAGGPLSLRLATTDSRFSDPYARELLEIGAAVILWTSGTTSAAKGVVLSHATLMNRVELNCQAFSIRQRDCVLWLLSMAHGVFVNIWALLSRGAKIVVADTMKPKIIPQLAAAWGITQIYAAPLFYRMLVNQGEIAPNDLPGVQRFISTTSVLPWDVAETFRMKFGREISQYYGVSEIGAPLVNFSQAPSKRGSAGKPGPNYEIKLHRLTSGRQSEEEMGEICIRSPGLFDAYYTPWRIREEVLEDGWFRTGDIARRDADGFYWIVGRTKDVINVGGVNVFPQEVEELLISHPAVEEAIVCGVPEPRFGEVPQAKVKLCAGIECTEKEILRYANEKLSVFKALRSLEFVDEIPKTVTGKPRRIG